MNDSKEVFGSFELSCEAGLVLLQNDVTRFRVLYPVINLQVAHRCLQTDLGRSQSNKEDT